MIDYYWILNGSMWISDIANTRPILVLYNIWLDWMTFVVGSFKFYRVNKCAIFDGCTWVFILHSVKSVIVLEILETRVWAVWYNICCTNTRLTAVKERWIDGMIRLSTTQSTTRLKVGLLPASVQTLDHNSHNSHPFFSSLAINNCHWVTDL